MKTLFDVPAPAKINLFLHIIGRRADGYHLMQSVFVLLDLCDTLHFERLHAPTISREDVHGLATGDPLPGDDLCVRAARLLQSATGCQQGVHIQLNKRIPAQAGMGGGSSDAASCLIALNRLWRTGLSRPQLAALGVQLGADVPFFIFGDNAWVEGIGDQLTAIAHAPQRYVIVKPPTGLPTDLIFKHPLLKRDTELATMQGFADNASHSFGINDLQPVAEMLCPDIRTCIDSLKAQQLSARMTGSGSAVFAPMPVNGAAPDLPHEWFSCTCTSLMEHPLKNWADF
jgi:4-diphosphocytidyl-2-C-methyl-D-erythritol kinase